MTHLHVKVTQDPLEHKQTNGGRNQQFSRSSRNELLHGVVLQIVSGAHARHNKQDYHEPRIQEILQRILILHFVKRADDACIYHAVVHIDDMVQHHQKNRNPANIIYIILSHTFPTFATIFNILYKIGETITTN